MKYNAIQADNIIRWRQIDRKVNVMGRKKTSEKLWKSLKRFNRENNADYTRELSKSLLCNCWERSGKDYHSELSSVPVSLERLYRNYGDQGRNLERIFQSSIAKITKSLMATTSRQTLPSLAHLFKEVKKEAKTSLAIDYNFKLLLDQGSLWFSRKRNGSLLEWRKPGAHSHNSFFWSPAIVSVIPNGSRWHEDPCWAVPSTLGSLPQRRSNHHREVVCSKLHLQGLV